MSTAESNRNLKIIEGQLPGCLLCGRPVPLRIPLPLETGQPWECIQCNAVMTAILVEGCPDEWYHNVRRLPPNTVQIVRHSLQARGSVRQVRPALRDVRCPWETDLSRNIDAQIASGSSLIVPAQSAPFRQKIRRHGSMPYNPGTAKALLGEHRNLVRKVADEFTALVERGRARVSMLRTLATELLQRSAEDFDLHVCLSVTPGGEDYPGRHSLHVAMLSMAIGAAMGYDDRTLEELGLGCLVHDCGMQKVSGADVHASKVLTHDELARIASHPIHTCEMLREQIASVSNIPQLVAYQMHERCNGAGYPRGQVSSKIHPLAKIAAVADAFVALCSPRPHRPAMMPYFAVVTLLQEVRDGLFDVNVIRGLLRTVSLFPIGSYLDLGDNWVAKVIRCNPDRYDRPVVEAWQKHRLSADPVILDLAHERPDARLRPIEPPKNF